MSLCPAAPATVSTKLANPGQRGFRHPQGILDAWIFWAGCCPGTRAGGRADLCLPENRSQRHRLLRVLWAVGGAQVPASPGLNCQLRSGPGGLRPCGLGSRLPASRPQDQGPELPGLSTQGVVGGALLGWGKWPRLPDAPPLRSVSKGSTPQDCPFAYNSGKRPQVRLRMGRGINGRKSSRGWE